MSINGWIIGFQYISCYGLSAQNDGQAVQFMYFNTSHVTVYRQIRAAPFGMWIFQYISCYGLSRYQDTVNSILELFQYISCYGLSSVLVCKICDFFLFQYISCYGLSFFWSHSQKACRYFNTSHVTVYRRFFHNRSVLHKFQYISCYGLSQLATGQKYIENQFQYISCYGLSYHFSSIYHMNFLFQYISCYGLSCFGLNNRKLSIMISIHLMLRFIKMSK